MPPATPATSPAAHGRALCVDLDGTLLDSDILYESLLVLLARNPLYLILLPFWLLQGKAVLKRRIAARAAVDPRHLPYNTRVLELLRDTPQRPRVLCTASDQLLVAPIAAHLGLFEQVIASDGQRNLSGARKAQALVDAFGERGFDYAGNGTVDLPVWARASGAWVVNNGPPLASAAARHTQVLGHWPGPSRLQAWVKALRPHQWLKNLLVFVPLLTAHRFLEATAVADALLAFAAFSLCASGVYVLNDLLDLGADRRHPRKRLRPFAAGRLPLLHGLFAGPLLTLCGLAIGLACSPSFATVLLGYYALTLGYSLRLKRVVMLDVVLLAGLYTLRIIGGTVAIGAELSFWLLAFSMFIFLSLALLKRYTELHSVLARGNTRADGRGYDVEDLPLLQSLGAAAGYCAVLVMALYINSPDSVELYRNPKLLWFICPILLYWVSRTWVIAHRGKMHDDPIVFAATDRVSQIVAALCVGFALVAI
ncbi:UbiA family prenyltransferase [Stenotrophomonas maltophilia]|uniref:UbiA family prenyltransferase n=1 Tax=Stenotrophomonas maltophilia TaxID=40324 RepID=UPI0009B2C38C|nr:UbiA family prenyltransferase [Stenotrophomonas maltophilia]MBH1477511.1 UbiA family prenyltransferase [Stenotrophomonas maltophilia]MBH1502635.1 UbiA family prenyltransferase [Stenotrophomonas maltophilia]MBH1787496.1 UbiA family prenyltransferase [Stenotrophomonas maltophilia]